MTVFRAPSFFLAGILAGSLAAQASDNTVRTLSIEGITFKLPSGWSWQSELASNIAIQKEIKIKEQAYTVTAEMVFQAEAFLEDTIKGIEKKVATSKGDLKDLKVARGEKFAGQNAVLVSYVRTRGEKQDELEDERQYLFRRNNALYTWTERAHRLAQSQANGAFSAARNAITFTGKDSSKAPKMFTDEGIKYTIPPDWEYEKVEKSKDPKFVNPIMSIETQVTVKQGTSRVSVALFAYKNAATLDDMEKEAEKEVTRNFAEVQDYKLVDKQVFNGEKAIVTTFSGKPVQEHQSPSEVPRFRRRDVFMKRKGYYIRWIESTPDVNSPLIDAALKKAREGLSWL